MLKGKQLVQALPGHCWARDLTSLVYRLHVLHVSHIITGHMQLVPFHSSQCRSQWEDIECPHISTQWKPDKTVNPDLILHWITPHLKFENQLLQPNCTILLLLGEQENAKTNRCVSCYLCTHPPHLRSSFFNVWLCTMVMFCMLAC